MMDRPEHLDSDQTSARPSDLTGGGFAETLAPPTTSPDSETPSDLTAPKTERRGILDQSVVAAGVEGMESKAHPRRFGGYQIIRVLGEGGMGVVYEAQQDVPRRIVALKVVHPQRFSKSLMRRFELETEVLGRLEHPNIARIYEAGTVETELMLQPFFAMELVRGLTLNAHTQKERLDPAHRLELLATICDAVHHAHQKGVIHRDLKPGNILVDAAGEPKILDFGVARATDSDLQTTTLETSVGQLIGTLQYMSPEQAGGDPRELDIRSDIYSLGVIGYELLAERMPYSMEGRMLHDAIRAIQEEEPTRLGGMDRSLRGDVETIIAKAMEKEKSRRYQSASDFAADIRRYLHDEPVTARPASVSYQLRKFAKRNRVLVSGLAAVFLALILGLITTTLEAKIARKARIAADAAAEQEKIAKEHTLQSLRNEQSITHMLTDALVAPVDKGYNVTVLQAIKYIEPALKKQSDLPLEVRQSVRLAVAQTYTAYAQWDDAINEYRQALSERAIVAPPDDEGLAEIYSGLAYALLHGRGFKNAEEVYGLYNMAYQIRVHLYGQSDATAGYIKGMMAMVELQTQSRAKGEQTYLEALRPIFGMNMTPREIRAQVEADAAQIRYMWAGGDRAGAEAYLRVRLRPMLDKPEVREMIPDGLGNFALYVLDTMREDLVAEAAAITAVHLSEEIDGPDSAMHAKVLNYTGLFLLQRERQLSGLDMLQEAADISRRKLGPLQADTIAYTSQYIAASDQFRKPAQGAEARRALLAQASGDDVAAQQDRARVLHDLGQAVVAEEGASPESRAQSVSDLRDAVDLARKSDGPDSPESISFGLDLEAALRQNGQPVAAEKLSNELVAASRRQYGEADRRTGIALDRLGLDLQQEGRLRDAIGIFRKSHEVCVAGNADAVDVVNPLSHLADAQESLGLSAEAQTTLEELITSQTELYGSDRSETIDSRRRLARVVARLNPGQADALYRIAYSAAVQSLGEEDKLTKQIVSEWRQFHDEQTSSGTTTTPSSNPHGNDRE
jgi:serine/threonine protein kinase